MNGFENTVPDGEISPNAIGRQQNFLGYEAAF